MQVERYGVYRQNGECEGTCDSKETAEATARHIEGATVVLLTGIFVPKHKKKTITIEIPILSHEGVEFVAPTGAYNLRDRSELRFVPRGFSRWAQAEVEIEVSGDEQ